MAPRREFLRFQYREVLDDKTRELVQLAAALVAGCEH